MTEVKSPIEVVIDEVGGRGELIGLKDGDGLIKVGEQTMRIPVSGLEAWNADLGKFIETFRAQLSSIPVGKLEIQPLTEPVIGMDQIGTLNDNLRCIQANQALVWATTGPGGYALNGKNRNEDVYVVMETEGGLLIKIGDGMGGHEGGMQWAQTYAQKLVDCGGDVRSAANQTIQALSTNFSEGGVALNGFCGKIGERPRVYSAGLRELRHYSARGELKYKMRATDRLDKVFPNGEIVQDIPLAPQSLVGEIEANAPLWRDIYLDALSAYYYTLEITDEEEIQTMVQHTIEASMAPAKKTLLDARYVDGALTAEREARENLESSLLKGVTPYNDDDWQRGFDQTVVRIILNKKPLILKGTNFYRAVNPITSDFCANYDKIDVRLWPKVIEAGDIFLLCSDGITNNTKQHEGDSDEIDTTLQAAIAAGKTIEQFMIERAAITEARYALRQARAPEAQENSYTLDNGTLIGVQFRSN